MSYGDRFRRRAASDYDGSLQHGPSGTKLPHTGSDKGTVLRGPMMSEPGAPQGNTEKNGLFEVP